MHFPLYSVMHRLGKEITVSISAEKVVVVTCNIVSLENIVIVIPQMAVRQKKDEEKIAKRKR